MQTFKVTLPYCQSPGTPVPDPRRHICVGSQCWQGRREEGKASCVGLPRCSGWAASQPRQESSRMELLGGSTPSPFLGHENMSGRRETDAAVPGTSPERRSPLPAFTQPFLLPPRADAGCPLVPDAGVGSGIDPESKETVLAREWFLRPEEALNNYRSVT